MASQHPPGRMTEREFDNLEFPDDYSALHAEALRARQSEADLVAFARSFLAWQEQVSSIRPRFAPGLEAQVSAARAAIAKAEGK